MDFRRMKLGELWGRACLLFKNWGKMEENLQCFDSKRALDGAFFGENLGDLGILCQINAGLVLEKNGFEESSIGISYYKSDV